MKYSLSQLNKWHKCMRNYGKMTNIISKLHCTCVHVFVNISLMFHMYMLNCIKCTCRLSIRLYCTHTEYFILSEKMSLKHTCSIPGIALFCHIGLDRIHTHFCSNGHWLHQFRPMTDKQSWHFQVTWRILVHSHVSLKQKSLAPFSDDTEKIDFWIWILNTE